jgi:hypothetical protein
MAEKRTKTMELRAIRQQMVESPPPPPAGATVREWFAGLALMNPELMRGLSMEERVTEAMRIADELANALAMPKAPTLESMAEPSASELEAWEKDITAKREIEQRRGRDTAPQGIKRPAFAPRYSLPPPAKASVHFKRASDHLASAGFYSSVTPVPSGSNE